MWLTVSPNDAFYQSICLWAVRTSLQWPSQLCCCFQVNHDVLLPVEEYSSAQVIQFKHLVKFGNFSDVQQINDYNF